MVGNRIREFRTSRGLTLTRLAEVTGLSTGLISQVERNITDPSLETLRKIAQALNVPLFDLFREEEQAAVAVVRAERRMLVGSPHSQATYARVSPGSGRLELLEGRLEPGGVSSDEPWSHPSEECVVVLEGQLTVEAGGEIRDLDQGDSCYFDSRLPHRYVNGSDAPVRFLLAVTPPSF
ncbi:helix-turn-helix domain-containing protein [Phytoactinopolyspora limicola]|uniref:helix-turn-helix domain-containing protein n=1 Tax=Phytoactinopolyspora limicola TaxID=2715536 RepID=UPI00140B93F0|nr:cupin domain-containing protein [Phytoactinopolyspora limicola]